jgi:signal transduction histidine kinase
MKRRHSLRSRMMLLFTAVAGCLLAASSLAFYLLLAHEVRAELDHQLLETAGPVAADLASDPTEQDVDQLSIPGQYFEVLDTSGQVLQRSKNLAAGPLALRPPNPAATEFRTLQRTGHGRLRAVLLPFERGNGTQVLVLAMSRRHADEVLEVFRGTALVLLPLSLILTAALSAWYVGKSLRPLAEMTDRAAEMAARVTSARGEGSRALWEPLPVSKPADEIGRLAETFNQLAERVEAALAQLRQFVSDASHELRTPLAVLHGETELALSQPRTPEAYEQTLRLIEGELVHLSRMVEGLFTLSMADAGQLRLARDPLYLDEVLKESCSLMTSVAQAKDIALESELASDVAFRGDEAFLRELFRIFLDNAIRYSPPHTRVTVRLAKLDGHAQVSFEDRGCGIAAEHLPQIFKRFYRPPRVEGDEPHGGGLGLAIAEAIAHAQGALVECESAPGRGSTFTLDFRVENGAGQQGT